MNDEPEIPLLQDLLYKGQVNEDEDELEIEQQPTSHSLDENSDIEIEPDTQFEQDELETKESSPEHELLPDEITDDVAEKEQPDKKNQGTVENINPSTQQLMLEEEIRLILEKQMNKAHKKIMRLLNDRKT